jgi:hypothetical protein
MLRSVEEEMEAELQWRTEGVGVQPPRNSEVLTKLSRIPCSVESTSVTV